MRITQIFIAAMQNKQHSRQPLASFPPSKPSSFLRNSRREVFSKKMFLEISQNSQENTLFWSLFFKKKTPTQVFYCEF